MPGDPAIPLRGVYPQEMQTGIHTRNRLQVVTAASRGLIRLSQRWKQPECPSAAAGISGPWSLRTRTPAVGGQPSETRWANGAAHRGRVHRLSICKEPERKCAVAGAGGCRVTAPAVRLLSKATEMLRSRRQRWWVHNSANVPL